MRYPPSRRSLALFSVVTPRFALVQFVNPLSASVRFRRRQPRRSLLGMRFCAISAAFASRIAVAFTAL